MKADNCSAADLKTPTRGQMFRRSLVHVIVGLSCSGVVFVLPHLEASVLVAAVTLVFLSIEAVRLHSAQARSYMSPIFAPFLRESETRTISGASYLLVGCLITSLIFSKYVALSAMLYLSFGDPIAAAACTLKGKVRIWGKYLEGNLACLATCCALGVGLFRVGGFPPLGVLLPGALVASILQAVPSWINDNLTMPIGSALVMYLVGLGLH
jgi:dolichol kinase